MPSAAERPRYFGDRMPGLDSAFKLPVSVFLSGNVGSRTGLASDGVHIGEYTLQDPSALLFDTDAVAGYQYTNVTSGIAIGGATQAFTVTAAGDALYIGFTKKFGGLYIDMATAGIGSTVAATYWNGSAWTSFSEFIDTSTSLTAGTSNYYMTWRIPNDWALSTAGDAGASIADKYWMRLVAAGNYSTDPVVDGIQVMSAGNGSGLEIPFNGYLDRVSMVAATEASNNDLEFNIINLTSGETGYVTLLQAERVDNANVAPTRGVYFKKGDKLLLQSTAVAGTPAANVQLVFQFRV